MSEFWSFGRKLTAGQAVLVLLTVFVGLMARSSLSEVVAAKDQVMAVAIADLVGTEHLAATVDRKGSAGRGFLLTANPRFLEKQRAARADFRSTVTQLRAGVDTEGAALLDALEVAEQAHEDVYDTAFERRRAGVPVESVAAFFEDEIVASRDALDVRLGAFRAHQEEALDRTRKAASDEADRSVEAIEVIVVLTAVAAAAFGWLLVRSVTGDVSGAVHRMRNASAELQAAATQQASGSREQATAMSEVATTMSELLATSRQITESARRVADIAGTTGTAAETGDATVGRAQESIAAIRRQVDVIVGHMLDLGRKSQQVGAVLDIINELSEQTNILAINATIEAAGAGEAGTRFGVVADEIRKLADRVAGSTKEIRTLVDEVRASVNTTVMATESGSKAVDAGARQFGEVTASFRQIAGLVGTTSDAAREIELSTKQQSTAVEQVNVAVANVAQSTRETETSSAQTLQTAAELASLSGDLMRVLQPREAA